MGDPLDYCPLFGDHKEHKFAGVCPCGYPNRAVDIAARQAREDTAELATLRAENEMQTTAIRGLMEERDDAEKRCATLRARVAELEAANKQTVIHRAVLMSVVHRCIVDASKTFDRGHRCEYRRRLQAIRDRCEQVEKNWPLPTPPKEDT